MALTLAINFCRTLRFSQSQRCSSTQTPLAFAEAAASALNRREFEAAKGPTSRQVIQPLYTSSIGRWRRYRKQLASVLPILEP